MKTHLLVIATTFVTLASLGESYERVYQPYQHRKTRKRGKSQLIEHVRDSVNTTIYTKTKRSKSGKGKGGKGKGSISLPSSIPSQSPSVSSYPSSNPSVSPKPTSSTMPPSISPHPSISLQPSAYSCHTKGGRITDIITMLDSVSKHIVIGSPQEHAATWLQFVDQSNNCNHEMKERYILATFYYSTDGQKWKNQTNWLSNEDHCSWFGVTCNNHNSTHRLTLSDNGLKGTIPFELESLQSLDSIVLDQNELFGHVPTEIFGLPDLYRFNVEENQLSGQLFQPGFFESSDTLKMLQIKKNSFSGQIPSEINSLTQLEDLRFDDNLFTGTLPSLDEMNNLIYLKGSDNRLNGTIPHFSDTMTKLKVIDLSNNEFSGSIPWSIGNLGNLEKLSLGGMKLEGSIPYTFWKLSNLRHFYAQDNQLTGSISEKTVGGLQYLETLWLSYNNFDGNIPDFSSNSRLYYLNLDKNALTGEIPSSLFELESLRILYLSNNHLTGTIPNTLKAAKKLEDLYLNDNKLTGLIPEVEADSLPEITEIVFNNNHLAGPVPDVYCEIDDLHGVAINADCAVPLGGLAQNECDCCAECTIGKGAILSN